MIAISGLIDRYSAKIFYNLYVVAVVELKQRTKQKGTQMKFSSVIWVEIELINLAASIGCFHLDVPGENSKSHSSFSLGRLFVATIQLLYY